MLIFLSSTNPYFLLIYPTSVKYGKEPNRAVAANIIFLSFKDPSLQPPEGMFQLAKFLTHRWYFFSEYLNFPCLFLVTSHLELNISTLL